MVNPDSLNSDHGPACTSAAYSRLCADLGITPPMSAGGAATGLNARFSRSGGWGPMAGQTVPSIGFLDWLAVRLRKRFLRS